MKSKDVRVTTTSGFNGVEIIEYCEPITAHVVVGMNFFKDFFAGLSDIFGGKSNTYQNTLATINQEVIDLLRQKAFGIGANCILGLKIDNDEISSQNKSMLMVTAIGTPAKANFLSKTIISNQTKTIDVLDFDKFDFFRKKVDYLKKIDEDTLTIDDNFIEFCILNRDIDFADFFISSLSKPVITSLNIIEYFRVLNPDQAMAKLYNYLKSETNNYNRLQVVGIIGDLQLIDYSKIIDLIGNDDINIQKISLQLFAYDKRSYNSTDIEIIKDLIDIIQNTFKIKGSVITKKKMLSAKEKEVWKCECGEDNDIENNFCGRCYKDIYGFYMNEIKPTEAIKRLQNTMNILMATFN